MPDTLARPNRRLCVAHVLPFPGVGGTEIATLRLIRALEPEGVSSVAWCLRDAPDVAALFRDAGVPVRLWQPRPRHIGRRSTAHGIASFAAGLLRTRTSVVHCADAAAATTQVVTAARLLRRRVVCHVRNRNPRLSADITAAIRHVDRFVFVSRHTWSTFAAPVAPERGVVVYDGVLPSADADRPGAREGAHRALTAELGLPTDAELCGMVGRVEPQKDFATLARAAARVVAVRPRAHFVVIGGFDRTPEQRAHLPQVRAWIAAAGVTAHVHFLGFRSDAARLIGGCDVALLVTHHEGLPLVLWEAMAVGTPVVATAVDGVPEAIADGENGLLVRHEDADGLAAAVLGLLSDRERARALGRAGRAFVARSFCPQRFGAAVANVYRGLTTR